MNIKKTIILSSFCISLVFIYVFFGLRVDNSITDEDQQAISTLGLDKLCAKQNHDFSSEMACIEAIQIKVQEIGELRCASKDATIEPKEFIERNYGCCFDRARFIEKAARYYGFKSRHVFLIQPKLISLTNILPLGQTSHAASEILTSRGWMGVDSNEQFILVDEKGAPLTYSAALFNDYALAIMKSKDLYTPDLDIIYGLYSRHGSYHGRDIPGPEFVFSELLQNF